MSPNKMCGQVRWSGGGGGETFMKASLGSKFSNVFSPSHKKKLKKLVSNFLVAQIFNPSLVFLNLFR